VATDEEAAERLARRRGERVVLKACGAGILHKSDAGLVRVGVRLAEVRAAFREIDAAARARTGGAGYDGVLVQTQAEPGEEVIVGFKVDPQFGPVVIFGLGGIFVEVLGDVALRVAPLTRADAEDMVREIKAFPLLDGARGRPKADVDALVDLIMRVSAMAMDLRERVVECDLNPVRVGEAGAGVIALDALVARG
jgi:acetyltransferase